MKTGSRKAQAKGKIVLPRARKARRVRIPETEIFGKETGKDKKAAKDVRAAVKAKAATRGIRIE